MRPLTKKAHDKANAAYIIRAVNAHEALLSLAKMFRDSMKQDGSKLALTHIEEAIAKAEGK